MRARGLWALNGSLTCVQVVSEDTYEVHQCVEEAQVIITSNADPKTRVAITLTSPLMRESAGEEGLLFLAVLIIAVN